jgi:hypothetical protein
MKYLATLGAVCAVGLGAMSGQAQADIYHFTQTGTIESGFDTRGIFGADGADLSGRTYSATLTFDPSLLEFIPLSGPPFDNHLYIGASGIFEVKIDDVSYSFAAGGPYQFSYSSAEAYPGVTNGWTYVVGGSLNGSGGNVNLAIASATNFIGSLGLTPYAYALTDQDMTFMGSGSNVWDGGDFQLAFRPATVALTSEPGTLAPPAAVPEPASWALMIVGFGGAGAMLRGRRRGVFAA